MAPVVILVTAGMTGLAALALAAWMRTPARAESAWFGSGMHAVLASLGGAGAAVLARDAAELVGFAVLALACALLVVVDLATHRLPDRIVLPTAVVLVVTLTASATIRTDWQGLGRAVAGAATLGLGYLVLSLLAPAGLGLGDVKLASVLGLFLGWLGWSHLFVGTLAAFILGGVFAVVLLLTTRATRRTTVAFGPWMVAGAAVGAAWGPALVTGLA